jgi:large subunit ribosomal protein L10
MPPRLPLAALLCAQPLGPHAAARVLRSVATTASKSAAPTTTEFTLPADYVPPTQPPSARRPELRQSQLIRSYTSLLRSTPLMLFFQQGNVTALEWLAVRRELRRALNAVPPYRSMDGKETDLAPYVQFQNLNGRLFKVALKITEYYDAEAARALPTTARTKRHGPLVHDLSVAAYEATKAAEITEDSVYRQLEGLLQGSLVVLTIPAVSPAHLAAALSILSPGPDFPAPTRKRVPSYHDPIAQRGLAKIMLVGGRVENRVFDTSDIKWVGGIQGGLDGLRAQLVSILQGAGLNLTGTLESAGRSLWVSLESHRFAMEEKEKPAEGEAKEAGKAE